MHMPTDAASYVGWSVPAVLSSAEEENKRKYLSAAEQHHVSFAPFVVSVDRALGLMLANAASC